MKEGGMILSPRVATGHIFFCEASTKGAINMGGPESSHPYNELCED